METKFDYKDFVSSDKTMKFVIRIANAITDLFGNGELGGEIFASAMNAINEKCKNISDNKKAEGGEENHEKKNC